MWSRGFSKGMVTGFKSVLGVDLWHDAIQTYNRNHKGNGVVKSVIDFTDEELLDIKKIKVTGIIGGPSCQGFSMVWVLEKKGMLAQFIFTIRSICKKYQA